MWWRCPADAADAAGPDVAGKVVLTEQRVALALQHAVRERGAAGLLFDGMAMSGRNELDLPDARQYTSFWWAGATQPDGWGFVLSPRQGQRLREQLAAGKPVRVRAHVDSRFYTGTFEVVEAWLPGADADAGEVLLVSHLCHPKPGAHDNASGAAALLETAATLARLMREGNLPPLRRGIRFIWPPEMTGTFAWLAAHEDDLARGRWVAGLNLDMVGADQCQTGSTWELTVLPGASAGFADHLAAWWLRRPLFAGQRYEEAPFSGGSDHYILSDPTVGIPTPMLIQWPDKFYHTSADTPDRVSPDSLARAGTLAASYAAWLACAGPAEVRWLAHWMVSRYAAWVTRTASAALERLQHAEPAEHITLWRDYVRRSSYHVERMHAALGTLARLDPAVVVEPHARRVTRIAEEQRDLVRGELELLAGSAASGDAPPEAATGEAARLIPRRLARGPVDVDMALQAQCPDRRPELWSLSADFGAGYPDASALLQYWADGQRSVADIAGRVALETGQSCSVDLALRFFRLLEATGHLTFAETVRE